MNLINILIRVTFRPEYFNECINSILNQTYKNFNIICCYDDKLCEKYLVKYKDYINYYYINIESNHKLKYNLYSNDLLSKVKEGYIIFLDDDDKFYHDFSLETINNHLSNENDIVFWKFSLSDKLIYPKNINDIKGGEIANSTYCFHSKFKNNSKWDTTQQGDFKFIDGILKNKSIRRIFLDHNFTGTIWFDINKVGNFGKKFINLDFESFFYNYFIVDLESNFDKEYYLKKNKDLNYLKNNDEKIDFYNHWINFGKRELRVCSKKYEEKFLEKLKIAHEKYNNLK
jgi:hypothetical protein